MCVTPARFKRILVFPSSARHRIDLCRARVPPLILMRPFRSSMAKSPSRRSWAFCRRTDLRRTRDLQAPNVSDQTARASERCLVAHSSDGLIGLITCDSRQLRRVLHSPPDRHVSDSVTDLSPAKGPHYFN